jgi:hypothetical protein
MDASERRELIRNSLRIEPIIHGQVYTFQIAVPEFQNPEISSERYRLLKESLDERKSNLIPLIVRRTQKYSEEEEYEVVYGADWCVVAKELEIERLWAWVFDLTDEQAAAAKEEMEKLAGLSNNTETSDSIEEVKIQIQNLEASFKQQLEDINHKLDGLVSPIRTDEIPPKHPDLVTITQQEIGNLINNKKQASAAWKAIKHLKTTGREISWENLKKLAEAKKGKDKIEDFALGTFNKLQKVCQISPVT